MPPFFVYNGTDSTRTASHRTSNGDAHYGGSFSGVVLPGGTALFVTFVRTKKVTNSPIFLRFCSV